MTSCYFFPTPDTVVQSIIKTEAQGYFARVLEPAVGDGALLKAIGSNYRELVAFDINQENLSKVSNSVDLDKATLSCEDFLNSEIKGGFDLILSNPPFNNNLAHHVAVDNKKAPIEAAFVLKCLDHLNNDGKAIFILPSSIINGDKTKWLRERLVSNYKITSIYKLPKFSFKKVEGSFYVLCLENRAPDNYEISFYKSCNLSYILNSNAVVSQNYNLDPELLSRTSEYDRILESHGRIKLSSLASIARGNICATGKKQYIYHSTDFKSHIAWPKKVSRNLESSTTTKSFCLLLKRVGRLSSRSLSLYYGTEEIPCSDCVITITPNTKGELNSLRLLLLLRVSVALGADATFEISGSGANYISLSRFKDLDIPSHCIFDDLVIINEYKKLIIGESHSEALKFEEKIAEHINKEASIILTAAVDG